MFASWHWLGHGLHDARGDDSFPLFFFFFLLKFLPDGICCTRHGYSHFLYIVWSQIPPWFWGATFVDLWITSSFLDYVLLFTLNFYSPS